MLLNMAKPMHPMHASDTQHRVSKATVPQHTTPTPPMFSPTHLQAFTKALEADAQHTPPPPLRQYAATHLAMLSAALGHPHEALKTYHTVLTTCPDNVAALMGAAETHRARAARDLTRGVSTVAAWDLSCAWQLASRACALQGDMAACWKLLGDVLVLHATATPTGALRAELETSPPNRGDLWGSLPGGDAAVLRAAAGDAVAGGACHAVGLRLAAVQRAGAAYARVEALLDGKERGEEGSGSEEEQAHWNKAQGAARLDTAAALYHVCPLGVVLFVGYFWCFFFCGFGGVCFERLLCFACMQCVCCDSPLHALPNAHTSSPHCALLYRSIPTLCFPNHPGSMVVAIPPFPGSSSSTCHHPPTLCCRTRHTRGAPGGPWVPGTMGGPGYGVHRPHTTRVCAVSVTAA